MPEPWLRVARRIARTLADHGQRAWIVGGAVRDLALSIEPVDMDMACAATPEQIEALFERTLPVGKAFGTVVVHMEVDVQVTTFRSESGHSDSRHPDHVEWGKTPEEDSERRDFTCNALYLDPLDDTLLDPHEGLADLERGVLRTVGEPGERFEEDGLRLVRMARFAAQLGLEVEPRVLEAARERGAALVGVSPERCLGELKRILGGPAPARGLQLLASAELLDRILPGFGRIWPDRGRANLDALERLGPAPGAELGLAALLGVPTDSGEDTRTAAAEILAALRPSRDLRRAVTELWRIETRTHELAADAEASLAARLRLVRADAWPTALRLARARSEQAPGLDELERFAAGRGHDECYPAPLLTAADLEAHGVPRSPRFGALLREVEDQQLEGLVTTREQALAWLAAQPLAAPEPRD